VARGQLTHRARSLLVRLGVLGGLLAVPAVHGQAEMRAVPFLDLASGESSAAGEPKLHVAATARQRAALARATDRPDLAARLEAPDLRDHTVVGVFAGPMPSSGHGVSVKKVEAGAGTVRITVQLTRPRPGQNVNDVITFPYTVVAVPASQLPHRATWSVTGTQGERILPPQRR
jgi:hypothetical protein